MIVIHKIKRKPQNIMTATQSIESISMKIKCAMNGKNKVDEADKG